MTCRVCQSSSKQFGLLYQCTVKSCGAAYWDKYAIKRLVKENKETAKEASPEWLSAILKEAQIPEFKRGEYYVYTIKLRKNLPKNTSAKRQSKMPNKGNGRFYVGMTGLHPYERYLNHIRGYKASWAANKMAVSMIDFEGPMTREEAEAREPERAQELRDKGFDVHSN